MTVANKCVLSNSVWVVRRVTEEPSYINVVRCKVPPHRLGLTGLTDRSHSFAERGVFFYLFFNAAEVRV